MVIRGQDSNLLRYVELSVMRSEGGINYHIGSIMINAGNTSDLVSSTSTTLATTSASRWRLNSRNASNTQLTLPFFLYRLSTTDMLRIQIANAATYTYTVVGYY